MAKHRGASRFWPRENMNGPDPNIRTNIRGVLAAARLYGGRGRGFSGREEGDTGIKVPFSQGHPSLGMLIRKELIKDGKL